MFSESFPTFRLSTSLNMNVVYMLHGCAVGILCRCVKLFMDICRNVCTKVDGDISISYPDKNHFDHRKYHFKSRNGLGVRNYIPVIKAPAVQMQAKFLPSFKQKKKNVPAKVTALLVRA